MIHEEGSSPPSLISPAAGLSCQYKGKGDNGRKLPSALDLHSWLDWWWGLALELRVDFPWLAQSSIVYWKSTCHQGTQSFGAWFSSPPISNSYRMAFRLTQHSGALSSRNAPQQCCHLSRSLRKWERDGTQIQDTNKKLTLHSKTPRLWNHIRQDVPMEH